MPSINEFMKKAKELDCQMKSTNTDQPYSEIMADNTDIWSNNACRGYFMIAARHAGLDEDQIHSVLETMSYVFDDISVDEAEKIYTDR